MKILTRIRLINWHYFENETLDINGSALLCGENGCGKSTLLDAIQLVLTTNTKRFNVAANEKSNRDLKGYARCKTGNEGKKYLRNGNVVCYVALEFFDDKKKNYFVIGVKIDSPDEESRVESKWFIQDCRLENLNFITNKMPTGDKEFTAFNKPVDFYRTLNESKNRVQKRLGSVDSKFFELIPKSLAFKPMDDVKDFINKFMLQEKTISIDKLKINIDTLKKLESLMNETESKIESLKTICNKYVEIEDKECEIKIIEILIELASLENQKNILSHIKKQLVSLDGQLQNIKNDIVIIEKEIQVEADRLIDLNVAKKENSNQKLIESAERNLALLKEKKNSLVTKFESLKASVIQIQQVALYLTNIDAVSLVGLYGNDMSEENKLSLYSDIFSSLTSALNTHRQENYKYESEIKSKTEKKNELETTISNLKKKKLTYPRNTELLKKEIEIEFARLSIKSKVYVFCEMLEINGNEWQNAVEGYLNTQRFNIFVDPKYFSTAKEVYNRFKKEIHTVGLIDAGSIEHLRETNPQSLAYVVRCEDRNCAKYVQFLLGNVMRCDEIESLTNSRISITKDCMLYKNYVVRKISEDIYRTPFIGANVFEIQLQQRQNDLLIVTNELKELTEKSQSQKVIIEKLNACNLTSLKDNLFAPKELEVIIGQIKEESQKLAEAKQDINLITLNEQIEKTDKVLKQKETTKNTLYTDKGAKESEIKEKSNSLNRLEETIAQLVLLIERYKNDYNNAYGEAERKLKYEVKAKDFSTIQNNFSPRLSTLKNQKQEIVNALIKLQTTFNQTYTYDFEVGVEKFEKYIDEKYKLESAELSKHREQLQKAKDNCEEEFRDSFLAELKEGIESAIISFKELNSSLSEVRYGDEYYKFEISPNKVKESLYRMIMSEDNLGLEGNNLFKGSFEGKYKDEIEDLFSKITAASDSGDKVLEEYTDYRKYLDYDIEVTKNGERQRFSKIYGEKSGGETQTPYYVAIAASFRQIYKDNDTLSIILLDEAFDKMSDDRIAPMMEFFKSMNFQVLLATPTEKLNVLGEYVDTVLAIARKGGMSFVNKFEFSEVIDG